MAKEGTLVMQGLSHRGAEMGISRGRHLACFPSPYPLAQAMHGGVCSAGQAPKARPLSARAAAPHPPPAGGGEQLPN